jgi:hypothetical protein
MPLVPRIAPAAGVAAVTTAVLLGAVFFAGGAAAAEAPVGLGTSGSYSVLGGAAVTNTGPTTLSGDLGVSPGTAITGFPPGVASGATHAGDAVAAQAKADLVVAYNDAAGRALTSSVAGDLVGRTLTSGVYKSTGPLAVSGTLTLDGQGNPNAVFIFQVASTLITASASNINVINGADACHVYWQVGSSATLGTASTFRGTIMALTSVTATTGTVVHGRALARNGAVTLDTNTFTSPGCAAATTPSPAVSSTATPTSTATGNTGSSSPLPGGSSSATPTRGTGGSTTPAGGVSGTGDTTTESGDDSDDNGAASSGGTELARSGGISPLAPLAPLLLVLGALLLIAGREATTKQRS